MFEEGAGGGGGQFTHLPKGHTIDQWFKSQTGARVGLRSIHITGPLVFRHYKFQKPIYTFVKNVLSMLLNKYYYYHPYSSFCCHYYSQWRIQKIHCVYVRVCVYGGGGGGGE